MDIHRTLDKQIWTPITRLTIHGPEAREQTGTPVTQKCVVGGKVGKWERFPALRGVFSFPCSVFRRGGVRFAHGIDLAACFAENGTR